MNTTYVMEFDAVDGTWVRIARCITPAGKVVDLPAEDVDMQASYVVCQSESMLDRNNDVYEPDWDVEYDHKGDVAFDDKPEWVEPKVPVYGDAFGYTRVPGPDFVVRCWFCNHQFSYERDYVRNEQGDAVKERFVAAMQAHLAECRNENVVPYVTTYFPPSQGRTVLRPDGSVAAQMPGTPGVVRTWRIKGGLLGAPASKAVRKQSAFDALMQRCRTAKNYADNGL